MWTVTSPSETISNFEVEGGSDFGGQFDPYEQIYSGHIIINKGVVSSKAWLP